MDSGAFLRAKYADLAKTLGDIEFQIHTLSKLRDETRAKMLQLDQSLPDFKKFEQLLTSLVTANVKESYEKKAKREEEKEIFAVEGGGRTPTT